MGKLLTLECLIKDLLGSPAPPPTASPSCVGATPPSSPGLSTSASAPAAERGCPEMTELCLSHDFWYTDCGEVTPSQGILGAVTTPPQGIEEHKSCLRVRGEIWKATRP